MSGAATKPKFELIDDITPTATTVPTAPATDEAINAKRLLTIALISLSKRAVTAVTNLFSLFLVGSVAILLSRTLDDPTPNRLAGVGGYAVFCLLIDIVRRKSQ